MLDARHLALLSIVDRLAYSSVELHPSAEYTRIQVPGVRSTQIKEEKCQ